MFNISRKTARRAIIVFTGVFLAMFCLRLIYGYKFRSAAVFNAENPAVSFDFGGRSNYASEKIAVKEMKVTPIDPAVAAVDINPSQKYEKVATLLTKSNHYDRDEASLYQLIDSSGSIIQYENKTGNKGNQHLELLVGVNPEKFDSFYLAAQRIGVVVERDVTKTDKTNEYQKLNAQRVSLEKTLSSLNELKNKTGKIDEYLSLHDKIYQTETQLQNLGVELGNFDSVHEFCTVKIYMFEIVEKPVLTVGIWTRIIRALEWTIKYYACLLFGAAFSLGCLLFVLKIWDFFANQSTKKSE
ncbi:DUF4349 domain-containing protein [Chitinophaga sp. Cy-1792]|uniref:DUF4349 domain-containing protein n=1 Tax=Chitinophaga sp. Cy-1792 TaxID=2608339 RepID=UPI00141F5535|nr:DUF4349 domain-containing protein [Chitinophaga sp. Cy-1792]NIG53127.1 DUF4349 domain-containing protein [Chitinophaga sp. Cy-1792]